MLFLIDPTPCARYKYIYNDLSDKNRIEAICPKCKREIIYTESSFPPQYVIEGGTKYPDFLQRPSANVKKQGLVASDRAFSILESNHIKGYKAVPVSMYECRENNFRCLDNTAPSYYFLGIHTTISLDLKAMHYRKKNVCAECGQFEWSREKIGNAILDYDTWNGDDFCRINEYPNYILCSERIIALIRKNKLKGVEIREESDIFNPLKGIRI